MIGKKVLLPIQNALVDSTVVACLTEWLLSSSLNIFSGQENFLLWI